MKGDHYTIVRHHYIYIIYHEIDHATFIGKTYSRDPYTVLNAHLRGERASTREDFGSDPDWNDLVNFHILESLECTGADAYRHVIAWCRFFEDAKFTLIVPYGTARYSEYFQPETQAIYDAVCALFTVEEVLSREIPLWEGSPTNPSPVPSSFFGDDDDEPSWKTTLEQLNIRVKGEVAESFRYFCKKEGITQSTGLQLLLLSQKEKRIRLITDSFLDDIHAKDEKIAKLKEELEEAKEKLAETSQKRANDKVCATVIRRAVKQAIKLQKPDPYWSPMYPISFYRASKVLDFSAYSYPSENGYCFIELDALVYGRGPRAALFVLGHTADDSLIKLRWYPKKEFIGISPAIKSPFYHKGSCWSVGYFLANDGAYDIYAAVPVDKLGPDPEPVVIPSSPSTRSLDSIIAGIEKTS